MGQLALGVNHRVANGSVSDFNFTVTVPEPSSVTAVVAIVIAWKLRRRG
jgi:hypothetical protein